MTLNLFKKLKVARDIVQLVDHLYSIYKVPSLLASDRCGRHTYNLSIREVKAEGSEDEGRFSHIGSSGLVWAT